MFIEELAKKTEEKLEELSGEKVFLEFGEFGDFSTSLPLRIAKRTGKNPDDLAKEWAQKIKIPGIHVKQEGGFLNFFLDDVELLDNLKYILEFTPSKKVATIDYSSPNIAKPFSVGHLRSTVIGESVRRILDLLGWKTVGLNFIGDWGTQFGKLLLAYQKWPVDLEKEPIKKLLKLYVKFHEEAEKNPQLNDDARAMFKKLEGGDKEAVKLWKSFRKFSLDEFDKIYKLLKISKLEDASESKFVDKGQKLVDEFLKKGIAEESEGAVIIPVEGKTPLILRKKDGTTIYSARDLASGIWRSKEFKPDLMAYVVGNEQKLHFAQLFSALKDSGINAEMKHISFGMLRLPEGKMSTRKGRVVFLEDVLNKAMDKVKDIMTKRGVDNESDIQKIGTGAVKFADLKNNRTRNVVFDWNMISFEGETGPYVQYSAVRAKRIGEKFGKGVEGIPEDFGKLVRKLVRFRVIVKKAEKTFRPDLIANYAIELAKVFNETYAKGKIGGIPEKEWIANKTFTVLEKSLHLLGIEVPEKM
ncbi:MAG: arginine--tRNA ligase [Candidatus Altiarchaeota archaeon]|nr:arginine--tRNA ligase [Candidatus Altiarchaeota archaeon]